MKLLLFSCMLGLTAPLAHGNLSLTVYNQNLALVRDVFQIHLKSGDNRVEYLGASSQTEPDSVILRDSTGQHPFEILEQNFHHSPATQAWLLSQFEGKELAFAVPSQDRNRVKPTLITGRIIRSGYVPDGDPVQPIVEVHGQWQFSLPGEPRFPAMNPDTILKPSLNWVLRSSKAETMPAEVDYVTEGLNWSATYNLMEPDSEGPASLNGWITLENRSGTDYKNAKVQVMAGDVGQSADNMPQPETPRLMMAALAGQSAGPEASERSFDDFHLYSLPNPLSLKDQEIKQVSFIQAAGVKTSRTYLYDGLPESRFYGRLDTSEGMDSSPNTKVRLEEEIVNSKTNHLGIPLPAGTLRIYREDSEGNIQLTGVGQVQATPQNETLHLATGNAFDITGERQRIRFQSDDTTRVLTESFSITIHNSKPEEAVKVQVREHLSRWKQWTIVESSDSYVKLNAQTVEFPVIVPADSQKTLTYAVKYTW